MFPLLQLCMPGYSSTYNVIQFEPILSIVMRMHEKGSSNAFCYRSVNLETRQLPQRARLQDGQVEER